MDYTSLIKEVNIPELVKALRCGLMDVDKCNSCKYILKRDGRPVRCGFENLELDAAAAIEALMDAEKTYLAELAQCHENLRRAAETRRERDERIEALQSEVQELKRVNLEIFEDLPKLGEWIWDDKRCIYVCSVCGSPKVRENMDRQIIKEQAYCYSCGAKMREVQE